MKKFLFFAGLLVFIACDRPVAPRPPFIETDFTVRFIYVGQADATLITTPRGKAILVDMGTGTSARDYILPLLDSLNIARIDIAFASHMHGDHIGGFDDLLASVPLAGFSYDHGGSYSTNDFENYLLAVGDRRRTISVGDTIFVESDVRIVCYASGAEGLDPIGENEKSVALIVSYKGFDLFLGGDLTGTDDGNQIDIESYIAPSLRPVEMMKADHHASRYCNNANILAALQPKYIAVSCGIGNSYGFPHDEAMDRFAVWGEIYRTDLSGTITVTVVDSMEFTILTEF